LWPTGAFNGIVDEVKIYSGLLSETAIHNTYLEQLPLSEPQLAIPDSRHAADPHRPVYHAMPPTHWTNEPYGLIFHEDFYHLFYQKNPNGPYHTHMHWGHLRSRDLVTWEEQPIALAPELGWDQQGIWSGHTVKNDTGGVVAFYTGVDGEKAGIGMAYPVDDDLKVWEKHPDNPLITNPPDQYNHMDFRDPFVWKHQNTWYMIVGSGIHHVGGILMTYTSPDLINWKVAQPLYFGQIETSGRFWEMPAFINLENNRYLLLVNTVPWEGAPAETLYWIGTWQGGRFQPDQELPHKLDLINGPMLAPSIQYDQKGRLTAIGIIPETRSSRLQNEAGWAHLYSLPRVWRVLEDGKLGQIPHPNVCRLRDQQVKTVENQTITPGNPFNLINFPGSTLELEFNIHSDQADSFEIQLSGSAPEKTRINFQPVKNLVGLDRIESSLSTEVVKDYQEGEYIFSAMDTINVRIFIDRSVVEVFVDELTTFAARIYPTQMENVKVDVISYGGELNLVQGLAWQLMDQNMVNTDLECNPGKLPDKFRTDIVLSLPEYDEQRLAVYPNPSSGLVQVVLPRKKVQNAIISLTDLTGRTVLKSKIVNLTSGNPYILNLERLPSGIYFVLVEAKDLSLTKKIFIK
jgi:sucrose-6-phosphate hydrolase SacC (GH32 family)